MAKQVIGKNGHLCIEMTISEALHKCRFGVLVLELGVCDNCNTQLVNNEEPVYYIAVLNELFCKDCFDDYIENAPYYEEDKDFEIEHYNYYAKMLNLEVS